MSTSDGSARAAFSDLDRNVPPHAGASDDQHAGAGVAVAAPCHSKPPTTTTPRAVPPPSPTTTDGASRGAHKPAWYVREQHLAGRRRTAAEIEQLLRSRKPNPTAEWLQKLPKLVKCCEKVLFQSALSFREYSDPSTLNQRLRAAWAASRSRHAEQPVPPPVPTSPGGASPALAPDHRGHVQNDEAMRRDDRDADAHDTDAAEAADDDDADAAARPGAAPVEHVGSSPADELVPRALEMVRGPGGHQVLATNQFAVAAALEACSTTCNAPNGNRGLAFVRDAGTGVLVLFDRVQASAEPHTIVVGRAKHGGPHALHAVEELVAAAAPSLHPLLNEGRRIYIAALLGSEQSEQGGPRLAVAEALAEKIPGAQVLDLFQRLEPLEGKTPYGSMSGRVAHNEANPPETKPGAFDACDGPALAILVDFDVQSGGKHCVSSKVAIAAARARGLDLVTIPVAVAKVVSDTVSYSPAEQLDPKVYYSCKSAADREMAETGDRLPEASVGAIIYGLSAQELVPLKGYVGSAGPSMAELWKIIGPALMAAATRVEDERPEPPRHRADVASIVRR